jgi:hypothetical protein
MTQIKIRFTEILHFCFCLYLPVFMDEENHKISAPKIRKTAQISAGVNVLSLNPCFGAGGY